MSSEGRPYKHNFLKVIFLMFGFLSQQSDNKASIKLGKDSKLDEGFQLLIGIEEIHKPRVWIEEPEPGSDDQVTQMLLACFVWVVLLGPTTSGL